MKKLIPVLAGLFLVVHFAQSQTLVSSEYLGHKTPQELAVLDTPIINGVDYYRLIYTTSELDGSTTEVSGLIAIPDDLTKRYPRAVYQHGTAGNDMGVPSFESAETDIALTLCGKGYVVCAPDYLGLGVDDGLHPYVHAESEAWVAVDMLRAADQFLMENNVEVNEQIFVTGYSQGGHAAAALHRMMETELSGEFTVTASAPMSGPYDISGIMSELIFSDEEYGYPGYLIYTLVSYQEVYGNIYTSVEEVVKEPYRDLFTEFAADAISLEDMNTQLIDLLEQNEGASIAGRAFEDAFVDAVLADPDHPANVALRDNDVYDWAPAAPTRLYYCTADDQVSFENSLLAEAVMNDNGATDVEAIAASTSPFVNHVFCAFFAPAEAADFFAQYQIIENLPPSSAFEEADSRLDIFPNPASERVSIRNFPADGLARIFDMSGKTIFSKNVNIGDNVLDVSHLPDGMYVLEVVSGNRFWKEKIIVN